ncbi:MAG TPA: hypothetical protein VFV50_08140 [Bdellovibrionales bacterium]|nr:hypothetical protein [Bdellovibrionales bacterium]
MGPDNEPLSGETVRAKSALRFQYEARAEVIKREIGDLEEVRRSLGLTRREICQILMVDPSAWTRWVQQGAPPHIYQALSWYLQTRSLERRRAGAGLDSPGIAPTAGLAAGLALDEVQRLASRASLGLEQQARVFETSWGRTRRLLLLFALSQAVFFALAFFFARV